MALRLLNFSHPVTAEQLATIEDLAGQPIARTYTARAQFAVETGFVEQAIALIDSLGITAEEWQTEAWLTLLPSLNVIAGVVLAELHGRMGHFPSIVRLRPVDGVVTQFVVAEIINLETVRAAARARR
ncbi:MAG: CRISPR-associated protein Csx15 [Dehalococcoidia bacterium]|nr:CRISPR-associated protein Csx15 [Dehalococcoidia bacterium]